MPSLIKPFTQKPLHQCQHWLSYSNVLLLVSTKSVWLFFSRWFQFACSDICLSLAANRLFWYSNSFEFEQHCKRWNNRNVYWIHSNSYCGFLSNGFLCPFDHWSLDKMITVHPSISFPAETKPPKPRLNFFVILTGFPQNWSERIPFMLY